MVKKIVLCLVLASSLRYIECGRKRSTTSSPETSSLHTKKPNTPLKKELPSEESSEYHTKRTLNSYVSESRNATEASHNNENSNSDSKESAGNPKSTTGLLLKLPYSLALFEVETSNKIAELISQVNQLYSRHEQHPRPRSRQIQHLHELDDGGTYVGRKYMISNFDVIEAYMNTRRSEKLIKEQRSSNEHEDSYLGRAMDDNSEEDFDKYIRVRNDQSIGDNDEFVVRTSSNIWDYDHEKWTSKEDSAKNNYGTVQAFSNTLHDTNKIMNKDWNEKDSVIKLKTSPKGVAGTDIVKDDQKKNLNDIMKTNGNLLENSKKRIAGSRLSTETLNVSKNTNKKENLEERTRRDMSYNEQINNNPKKLQLPERAWKHQHIYKISREIANHDDEDVIKKPIARYNDKSDAGLIQHTKEKPLLDEDEENYKDKRLNNLRNTESNDRYLKNNKNMSANQNLSDFKNKYYTDKEISESNNERIEAYQKAVDYADKKLHKKTENIYDEIALAEDEKHHKYDINKSKTYDKNDQYAESKYNTERNRIENIKINYDEYDDKELKTYRNEHIQNKSKKIIQNYSNKNNGDKESEFYEDKYDQDKNTKTKQNQEDRDKSDKNSDFDRYSYSQDKNRKDKDKGDEKLDFYNRDVEDTNTKLKHIYNEKDKVTAKANNFKNENKKYENIEKNKHNSEYIDTSYKKGSNDKITYEKDYDVDTYRISKNYEKYADHVDKSSGNKKGIFEIVNSDKQYMKKNREMDFNKENKTKYFYNYDYSDYDNRKPNDAYKKEKSKFVSTTKKKKQNTTRNRYYPRDRQKKSKKNKKYDRDSFEQNDRIIKNNEGHKHFSDYDTKETRGRYEKDETMDRSAVMINLDTAKNQGKATKKRKKNITSHKNSSEQDHPDFDGRNPGGDYKKSKDNHYNGGNRDTKENKGQKLRDVSENYEWEIDNRESGSEKNNVKVTQLTYTRRGTRTSKSKYEGNYRSDGGVQSRYKAPFLPRAQPRGKNLGLGYEGEGLTIIPFKKNMKRFIAFK